MTPQETFLMTMFKANPAKELDINKVIGYVMRAKKVEDVAQVDVASIVNTLKSLSDSGKIIKREATLHNVYGDKTTEIRFYWVKGLS